MSIYTSTQVRPYVYICVHKVTGKFYIGYREWNVHLGKVSDVDFPEYKTSSVIVNPNFHEYNWQILAEFESGEYAYDFEQQLISEHWDDPLLLNEHCFYGKQKFRRSIPPWNKGKTGLQTVSEVTKEKIRLKRKFQVTTEATKLKISESLIGNTRSKKPKSIEARARMNKAQIGVKKPAVSCIYCRKAGAIGPMTAHHLSNCKTKP